MGIREIKIESNEYEVHCDACFLHVVKFKFVAGEPTYKACYRARRKAKLRKIEFDYLELDLCDSCIRRLKREIRNAK